MPPEHPDPELIAAIAAGERDDPATAEHLEGCEACASTLRELGDVTRLLYSLGGRGEAPGEAVWERVRDAALGTGAPKLLPHQSSGDPDGVVPLRPEPAPAATGRTPRRRVVVAALAGLAAGLAIGVVGVELGTPDPSVPDGTETPAVAEPGVVVARADLAPLSGAGPAGSARLVRGSERARLWIELPSAGGSVPRQVWLLDDQADVVAVGLLGDGQAGVFEVPLDVVESYQVVDVSAEPLDGDPAHSGDSLFRGALEAG